MCSALSKMLSCNSFIVSQRWWRSDPCCLDYLRQSSPLYLRAGLLRRHSQKEGSIMVAEHNVALQWNVRVKGQRGEGWRKEDTARVEGRGEETRIKDLDYGVQWAENEGKKKKWLPLSPVSRDVLTRLKSDQCSGLHRLSLELQMQHSSKAHRSHKMPWGWKPQAQNKIAMLLSSWSDSSYQIVVLLLTSVRFWQLLDY